MGLGAGTLGLGVELPAVDELGDWEGHGFSECTAKARERMLGGEGMACSVRPLDARSVKMAGQRLSWRQKRGAAARTNF